MTATKTNNVSLYILRFKSKPIVKIGLTTLLPKRINDFRLAYDDRFDLVNSYLVGCYCASRINALERELLANTKDLYSLKGKDYDKYKDKDGGSELRYVNCLDLVLSLIDNKIKLTNAFYFHEGISLERNLKAELPECIFDESGETMYQEIPVAQSLLKCIRLHYNVEIEKVSDEELLQAVLHNFIEANEIKLADGEKPIYKRTKKKYYAFEWDGKKWHWKKPANLIINEVPELVK